MKKKLTQKFILKPKILVLGVKKLTILLLAIFMAGQMVFAQNNQVDKQNYKVPGSSIKVSIKDNNSYVVQNNGSTYQFQTKESIKLRYKTFNPLTENIEKSIPKELQLNEPSGLKSGTPVKKAFIVQFYTQAFEGYQKEIEAIGAELCSHIPDNAMLVLMTDETKSKINELAYVRAIVSFLPAYKLGAELQQTVIQKSNGEIKYSILLHKKSMQEEVVNFIESIGGYVEYQTQSSRFEATLNSNQLAQLVQLPQILYIDKWSPLEADMDNVRVYSGANYIETVEGYTGQGVRAEVLDLDMNVNHENHQKTPAIIHNFNSGTNGHGTACFGIVFGSGQYNPAARGILPDAEAAYFADSQNFLDETSSGLNGRYALTAELVDPNKQYRCVFQTNSTGSSRTIEYNTISAEMDEMLFDLDFLMFQSMSNYSTNTQVRPEAWAKNMVSVGGISHYNNLDPSDDKWTTASSGPAEDGRLKPDLAGFYDATLTSSQSYDNNTSYANFSGTSGATPMVAGLGGLVMQMWADGVFDGAPGKKRDVFDSRPHMTTAKALMINSAKQWTFSGSTANLARIHQGWGFPNVKNLYDIAKSNNWSLPILINEDALLKPLETHKYNLTVDGTKPLMATLVYAEPKGNPAVTVQLINNLSLKVTSPSGTIYWGNNGLAAGNWSTSGGSENTRDNVENVFIQNPEAGTWSVEIIGTKIVQDNHIETSALDADYALVATGGVAGVLTQYTLNITPNVQGNVELTPAGGIYNKGTVVSLKAIGAIGYAFDHWTGDLSGSTNPVNVTMDANKTISPVYRPVPTYTLNSSVNGNGSIDPSNGTFNEDELVLVTATPSAGYIFSHWSGDASGNENPLNLVFNSNKNIVANFVTMIGYPSLGNLNTTAANRRAMPYVMPETGVVSSISIYHNGGSGDMILGIYEGTATAPGNRIAVTPSTQVSSITGWQEVSLENPIQINANQNIFLAWVFENNPGIQYYAGDPGRVDGGGTWTEGMPEVWGSAATQSSWIYNIYAKYSTTTNQAPVASINGPYSAVAGETITFSSLGSNDPDGTIVSYLWNFGDGSTSSLANPSHSYASAGNYTVSLTVTDNGGFVNTANTTANILAPNIKPIAKANGPYNAKVGYVINFSSAGSTDPDGTIASYLWAFGDGSSSTLANPSHTYTVVGNYTASLTVKDNEGASHTDNASVSILANQAPVAAINGPYNGTINNAVAFSSAGSDDPDGTIASYAWNFGDGSTSTLANPSHTYTTSGNYTVSLRVIDNDGENSAEVNTTAVITDAALDYAQLPYTTGFESGALDQYWFTQSDGATGRIEVTTAQGPRTGNYQLAMDVSTSGTYVTNEAWLKLNLAGKTQVDFVVWWKESNDEDHTQDGIFISDDAGDTFVKVYNLTGGTTTHQEIKLQLGALAAANGMSLTNQFVVKLQQYDNYPFTSDGMGFDDISVTSPAPQPPVAVINGPYNGTIGNPVAFSSAGSTDIGGTIVSYLWNFGDGSTSTLANPSHTYTSAGTFNISLTVTDNDGMSDVEYTTATITEAPLDYALLPYSTGFESGALDQYWFTQSDGPTGRIQITTAQGPRTGSYQLTMDVSTSGTYVTNEAWLKLNLAGKTQVDFSVWWKESSDEDHTQDGIFLSDDAGETFVKVRNLTGGSTTHQQIALDIDQLAAANGLSLTSTFVVKLQQYDNYPFTSDGFGFDDVNVSGSSDSGSDGLNIEYEIAGNISVYPNPVKNGLLNVSISGELSPGSYISIYNISGMLVKKLEAVAQIQAINLEGLTDGIYMLSVPVDGKIINEKFIIHQ